MPSLSRDYLALVYPATLRLERRGTWSSWPVPDVTQRSAGETADSSRPLDELWWRFPKRPKRKRPGPGLLEDFLSLAEDDSGKRIVAYAKRWGVLNICEHDLPCSHNPPAWDYDTGVPGFASTFDSCRPRTHGDPIFRKATDFNWEPLEVWREYARVFRALVGVAGRLSEGAPSSPSQWEALCDGPLFFLRGNGSSSWPRSAVDTAALLTDALTILLGLAGVRPHVAVVGERPAVTLGAPNLFGALTMQALMASSAAGGFYFCSGCGLPFVVVGGRRLQAGRNHYCPACGTGAARRDASRRYRARLRSPRSGPMRNRG